MPYVMYVALQGDDKLARFTMDPATGKLTLQEEIPVPGGPAPLAVDPQRRFLYVGRRGQRIMSSFRIEPGALITASATLYPSSLRLVVAD